MFTSSRRTNAKPASAAFRAGRLYSISRRPSRLRLPASPSKTRPAMTTDPKFKIRRLWRDKRGAALVLVALSLTALIGMTGLAVDVGLWYTIKRYNQSAADIAALSGAGELVGGQPYSDICNLAERAAQANGFNFVLFTC